MYESHVQHPVRFVQYEEFECFQANETLVDQVLQSSGSCNQYLYSTFQFICLWLLSYTAEDDACLSPVYLPYALKHSPICMASSRVGVRMSALILLRLSVLYNFCKIGMENAAVLPVPV